MHEHSGKYWSLIIQFCHDVFQSSCSRIISNRTRLQPSCSILNLYFLCVIGRVKKQLDVFVHVKYVIDGKCSLACYNDH